MSETIGKYRILERIGRGGMGTVFKAYDPALDRLVAVKVISADAEVTDELKARFYREAQACAKLNHPNIVVVHDLGEDDGRLYFVMEFLEGEELRRMISQRMPVSLEEKLRLIRQVCDGLHYAHQKGIIHRDIKPGNIFVLRNGQAKILDFGIARVATADVNLTRTGLIMGTLRYISPEQARGRADHRSDIFSVGAVLYELLTFQPAFDSQDPVELLEKIRAEHPTPLSEVDPTTPPELAGIVERALRKDPGQRFPDLAEMQTQLDALMRRLAHEREELASQVRGHLERLHGLHVTLGGLLGQPADEETQPITLERARMEELRALDRKFSGQLEALENRIREAEALEPVLASGLELVGTRDFAGAIAHFERVLEAAPDHRRALESLDRARRLRDEQRRAAEQAQRALQQMEQARRATEDADAARHAAASWEAAEVLAAEGRAALDRGDHVRARARLEEAAEAYHGAAAEARRAAQAARVAEGRARLAAGDPTGAIERFEAVLAEEAGHAEAGRELGEARARQAAAAARRTELAARRRAVEEALERQDVGGATAALARLAELGPERPELDALRQRVEECRAGVVEQGLAEARRWLAEGEPERGLEALGRVRRLAPEQAEAGRLEADARRVLAEREAWARAEPFVAKARALSGKGEIEPALAAAEEAVRLAPSGPQARELRDELRGRVLARRERVRQLLATAQEALGRDDIEGAERGAAEVLALEPNEREAQALRARAQARGQELTRARQAVERAQRELAAREGSPPEGSERSVAEPEPVPLAQDRARGPARAPEVPAVSRAPARAPSSLRWAVVGGGILMAAGLLGVYVLRPAAPPMAPVKAVERSVPPPSAQAEDLRRQVVGARERAAQLGAERLVPKLWTDAVEKERQADVALGGQKHPEALTRYRDAQQAYETAASTAQQTAALARKEADARRDQEQTGKARRAAELVEAPKLVPPLWARATEMQREAETAIRQQAFEKAQSLLRDAEKTYRQAERDASEKAAAASATDAARLERLKRELEATERVETAAANARRQAEQADAPRYAAQPLALAREKEKEGQAALGRQDYGAAQQRFREAEQEYVRATQGARRAAEEERARQAALLHQQTDAEQARDQVGRARRGAEQAGADRYADKLLASAQAKEREAQAALGRREYPRAQQLFRETQAEYERAGQEAQRAAEAERQRVAGVQRQQAEETTRLAALKQEMARAQSLTIAGREQAVKAEADKLTKEAFERARARETEADAQAGRQNFAAAIQTYQDAGRRYDEASRGAQALREARTEADQAQARMRVEKQRARSDTPDYGSAVSEEQRGEAAYRRSAFAEAAGHFLAAQSLFAKAMSPAAPPAPPVTDPQAEIRSVLDTLKRAIEARDLGLYRRVRPDLSDSEVRRIREAFDQTQSHQVNLIVQGIEIRGDEAEARVRRVDDFESRQGQKVHKEVRLVFKFKRTPSGWVIHAVD